MKWAFTLLLSVLVESPPAFPGQEEPPLPFALPEGVTPGPGDTVVVWSKGKRWTRSLKDGHFLDGGPAEWTLRGGWAIGADAVRHDGLTVASISGIPIAAATDGETLWLRDDQGVWPIGHPKNRVKQRSEYGASFVPFLGGIALRAKGGVVVRDARNRQVCETPRYAAALVASPDGQQLVVLGEGGIAVIDDQCHLLAGTPIRGQRIGFIDAERLAVVGVEGEIVVLRWPSLDLALRTPPMVDDSWEVAQGPEGPVLMKGRFVFDPQNATTLTLPEGTFILRERGLAFVPDGKAIRVLDLGGRLLRTFDAGFEDFPRIAQVDGERYAVTDGFVVAQSQPDGRFDRWTLADPVLSLCLRPEGVVSAAMSTASVLLRPGASTSSPDTLSGEWALPGGGRVHLVFGDASSPRAVMGSSGPTRVVETSTLRGLGPEIPVWFEEVALTPDGRLLVGTSGGSLCAFEVASGRELWSVPMDGRHEGLKVFQAFLQVGGSSDSHLLDLSTGKELWTIGSVSRSLRNPGGGQVISIRDGEGTWNSDAWAGSTRSPSWTGSLPSLRDPIPGEPIAFVSGPTVSKGPSDTVSDPVVPPPPESWTAAASGGMTEPGLTRLRLGRRLPRSFLPDRERDPRRGHSGRRVLSIEGLPTVVVYGRVGDLPAETPRGIRMIRIVVGTHPEEHKGVVPTTPELEKRLSLGPGPEALLVSATGRLLARGSIQEILAKAEDAGLEDVAQDPSESLTPAWTLQGPAPIERLAVLDSGDVFVSTKASFAIVSPDGGVRWALPVGNDDIEPAGDRILIRWPDRIESRRASDGSLLWHRAGRTGDDARTRRKEQLSNLDPETGRPRTGERIVDASGASWFRVPGGWCSTSDRCTERDPSTLFQIGDSPAWKEKGTPATPRGDKGDDPRMLSGNGWHLDSVVHVLQVDATRVVAQLGSESGPWAFVEPEGRLGALVGRGSVAAAGPAMVVIAKGSEVRAFKTPTGE